MEDPAAADFATGLRSEQGTLSQRTLRMDYVCSLPLGTYWAYCSCGLTFTLPDITRCFPCGPKCARCSDPFNLLY
jgi:hypothetical protein